MSRSNPNERPVNPSTKFFEWNGKDGNFFYYDKEKKTKVDVPFPFVFLVLDQLSTIKGWSDADQSGIWSNEVKHKDAILQVRTKKGLQVEGKYADIKGKVVGADFTTSVYIAFKDETGKLAIGNIAMNGSCLNAWIDFSKGKKVEEGAIRVENYTEAKKGAISYRMPAFISFACSQKTNDEAVALDATLQAYLNQYLAYVPPAEEAKPEFKPEAAPETKPSAVAPKDDFLGSLEMGASVISTPAASFDDF